jgi:hypothetical protein
MKFETSNHYESLPITFQKKVPKTHPNLIKIMDLYENVQKRGRDSSRGYSSNSRSSIIEVNLGKKGEEYFYDKLFNWSKNYDLKYINFLWDSQID